MNSGDIHRLLHFNDYLKYFATSIASQFAISFCDHFLHYDVQMCVEIVSLKASFPLGPDS